MRQLNKSEKLNPELVSFVEKSQFLTIFRHPLCVLPYSAQELDQESTLNGMINQVVQKKAELVAEMESDKDYSGIIRMVERPFRLEYAIKYLPHMSTRDYWSMVSDVWLDSEFPCQRNMSVWLTLFSSRPGNPALKSDLFESLPETLTIYRGGDVKSLSWTTNRDTAEWFADRYDKSQALWKGTINKRDILHVSTHESEVIVDPCRVMDAVDLRAHAG